MSLLVVPAGPRQDAKGARAREARLLESVRGAGLRVVGPSSLGVLNTADEVSLNAAFTGASVAAGALAICSPSGSVGIGRDRAARVMPRRQLRVSMFASLGNRSDVSTNDLLEYWEHDDRRARGYGEDPVPESRAARSWRPDTAALAGRAGRGPAS